MISFTKTELEFLVASLESSIYSCETDEEEFKEEIKIYKQLLEKVKHDLNNLVKLTCECIDEGNTILVCDNCVKYGFIGEPWS